MLIDLFGDDYYVDVGEVSNYINVAKLAKRKINLRNDDVSWVKRRKDGQKTVCLPAPSNRKKGPYETAHLLFWREVGQTVKF